MTGEPRHIAQVRLLDDDLRRRMYDLIRERGRPVTREEVARELGVSTNLAAFHLDKMTAADLLRARYQRPPGHPATTGRAPKVYEPSDVEIVITIPPRRHEILAKALLDALETRSPDESPRAALERVGREMGEAMGTSARVRLRLKRAGRERLLSAARSVLADYGYEPYAAAEGETRLRNCPFSPLSDESRDGVCSMNRALIQGLLRGLGDTSSDAVLDPLPDECCVALRRSKEVA